MTFKADVAAARVGGPLNLLDWKFVAVRAVVTVVLPLIALFVVFKSSVRIERFGGEADARVGVTVRAPASFFARLGAVGVVLAAVFVYF